MSERLTSYLGMPLTPTEQAMVDAAYEIGQAEGRKLECAALSAQCGDDPCKGCKQASIKESCRSGCFEWYGYTRQLAQAAKGQQLLEEAVKQEQQRIVERIDDYADHSLFGEPLTAVVEMLDSLRAWLQERGKHE